MKKTYVWVFVADPKGQHVTEVYGPCTEYMIAEVNSELVLNPIQGLSDNIAEVLCKVEVISPEVSCMSDYKEVIYRPTYVECKPLKPLKIRTIEKVLQVVKK